MTDSRPCTCAPDERPYPCRHKYALGLCLKAEIRSMRIELDRLIAQIADLTKLRLEDGLVHGNVMGRIAIALFGDQNNRTDEECVARAAEIGYELEGAKTAVLRATGKEVAWREMADKRGERVAELEQLLTHTGLLAAQDEHNALRHDIDRHVQIAADQAQEVEELRADLAAARALLGEARGIVHAYLRGWPNSDAGELMDRIDAALAGEKK